MTLKNNILHFAVIGNPIAHSLSPVIHQLFAEQANITIDYDKITCAESEFKATIFNFLQQGKGLNVTSPFKQQAFALADITTDRCQSAKAANTLWLQAGKLYADNTDGIGLVRDLSRRISLADRTILIIGAGGAARGIIAPLLQAQVAKITLVNRTLAKAEAIARDFPAICCTTWPNLSNSFDLIINASSAAQSAIGETLPAWLFDNKHYCYDLNYNLHQPTHFVAQALQYGCKAQDGIGMLVEQAAEAFFIWHQFMPETISVLHHLLTKRQKN